MVAITLRVMISKKHWRVIDGPNLTAPMSGRMDLAKSMALNVTNEPLPCGGDKRCR